MAHNTDRTTGSIDPNSGYISFNNETKASVIGNYSQAVDKFDGVIQKATAGELTTDIYVRSPFNRNDYDLWRPNEKNPRRFKDIIHACRASYLRVGVVRNVVDMMTDFATEDLKFIHPDKKVETFLKVWAKKINLAASVDEFVRHFLVDGNVVVKRNTAKLTKPVETQWLEKSVAADTKLYTDNNVLSREIPWRYTFLNVAALQWDGDEVDQMTGRRQLVFNVSRTLSKLASGNNDMFQQSMMDRIPPDVKEQLRDGQGRIKLDMDTIYVAYNKKDSWEDWAPPFLYSILSEIKYRDKLRQAEISALDGMINVIRLWKLGDHKEEILPNQAVIDKLIAILESHTGGGAMDIVWDSLIEMEEFYPPVDKILGSEKYEQVNRDILIGLGVPEVLIGGKGSNFSNSWIQLRTMVEKLEYVRLAVTNWLEKEIRIFCDAMDIKVYPRIKFNQMNLEDENVTRKLIVDLMDRGLISPEAVVDLYGEDFIFEVERIKRDKKILKDAGIELKSPLDKPAAGPIKTGKKGRPSQTKDVTRKQRVAKPRRAGGSVDLTVFALDAIDAIDEHITPMFLEDIGVTNARKLTHEQREEINTTRSIVLSCIKPSDDISKDSIVALAGRATEYNNEIIKIINTAINEFTARNSVTPTLTQRKRIEAVAWASFYNEAMEISET